jgi:hypothetical protein
VLQKPAPCGAPPRWLGVRMPRSGTNQVKLYRFRYDRRRAPVGEPQIQAAVSPQNSGRFKVLGNLWLREPERVDDRPDRPLPSNQNVEDVAPVGLGDRVEDVGSGASSSHVSNYMFISEYINADPPIGPRRRGLGICRPRIRSSPCCRRSTPSDSARSRT